MQWRTLQTGSIYVGQHPQDAQLTVDELRDMVGHEAEAFSNRVLHYAASLHGTRQYCFQQRNRLIAMVNTLGVPAIFLPTVLLISSGQSSPISSVLTILIQAAVTTEHSRRIEHFRLVLSSPH